MSSAPLVALDRRFTSWTETKRGPVDVELTGGYGQGVDWPAILEQPNVVILAEAGAGKSTEMRAQADRLRTDDRFAFLATVQDVGKQGLRAALVPEMAREYDAWLMSDKTAWFFIDSVDEARLDNVQLQTALRNVAYGIEGAERRAHIILSSRYTDWDFKADRETFESILPVQTGDRPPAPTPDEMLGHILRHDKLPEPPVTIQAAVFLMTPLDEERVRVYAEAAGASDIDAFIAAIEVANLWRFARRPLDLSWMVEFWRTHQRLGSLCEMLDASLSKRATEWNKRRGPDPLDPKRCRAALERTGAALVFGHAQTVAIPTIETSLNLSTGGLDLGVVLPDWSTDDVMRLLGRPAFDPSTFGRSRLHNDNEGDVRAFLAAQWLKRLRAANCPLQAIQNLLFAEVYENSLIRPAAHATAAWLSLWDADIAHEVIARDPMLLMNAGDPASLLPATRAKVLDTWISCLIADPDLRVVHDHDKLRRFTSPELSGPIRTIWIAHNSNVSIHRLLLMMIWLGRLAACVDLALEAALTVHSERLGQMFAGRAVATFGDSNSIAQFADHILTNAAQLDPLIVWDAVEHLLPEYLSVEGLLALLDQVPDKDGYGFRRQGADFAAKLQSIDQLTMFIEGILERARRIVEPPDTLEHEGVMGLFGPALATAAMRLMKRCPDDQAPIPAIDTYLWLNKNRHTHRSRGVAEQELKDELRRTSARRRTVFWRAAERLNGPSPFHDQPLTHHFQLKFFGWPGGLELNDLGWLLHDMMERALSDERQLALSAAHSIAQKDGSDAKVLARIAAAARRDRTLNQLHKGWLKPQPESEQMQRLNAEMAAHRAKHDAEQAERDISWRQFIEDLRADTMQIRTLEPPTDNTVDRRLYGLWQLAKGVCAKDNQYAFDSLAPIEPLLGSDLTEAFGEALIRFWRRWTPILRTDREAGKRDMVSVTDCIGIAAVSIEAAKSSTWAALLTFEEAALATKFATLELNGFPNWLGSLAQGQPAAVASVLVGEVAKELAEVREGPRVGVLERLPRAGPMVIATVAPDLLKELEARADLAGPDLETLLEILVRGLPHHLAMRLNAMVLDRAAKTHDLDSAGDYFAAAFAFNPSAAIDLLILRLDDLSPADQTALATGFLPKLFGNHIVHPAWLSYAIPFDALARLVLIAYRTIRTEDDLHRPSFQVFSPNERDDAEGARSAAFNRLFAVPGRATYDFLLELAQTSNFPIPPRRLRELAGQRSLLDAEAPPWMPSAAHAFEQDFEHAPTTALELQQLLLRRLEGLDHELVHGDFNQGRIFKILPDENSVQNWVAYQLRAVERRSYSVEREVHRAGEKKPDIAARAKASDASVAIEIKVVDALTVKELEEALAIQLCDKYLRAEGGRHGILLLVYQNARAEGWRDPTSGETIGFEAVAEHLRAQARQIAGVTSDSPQPVVAVLNVSGIQNKTQVPRATPIAKPNATDRGAKRRGKENAPARSRR